MVMKCMVLTCRSTGKYNQELRDDTCDAENLPPLQSNYFEEDEHQEKHQRRSEKKRWMTKSMRLLVNGGSTSDLPRYKYDNLQDDVSMPMQKSMPSPTPTHLLGCSPRSDDSFDSITHFDGDDNNNDKDDGNPHFSSLKNLRSSAIKLDFKAKATGSDSTKSEIQDKTQRGIGDDFDYFVLTKFHSTTAAATRNSRDQQWIKDQPTADEDKTIAKLVDRDPTPPPSTVNENNIDDSGSDVAGETSLYSRRLPTNLTKLGMGDGTVVNGEPEVEDIDDDIVENDGLGETDVTTPEQNQPREGVNEDENVGTNAVACHATVSTMNLETCDAGNIVGNSSDKSCHASINMAGIVDKSPSMQQHPLKKKAQRKEIDETVSINSYNVEKGKNGDELSKILDDIDKEPSFYDEQHSAVDDVDGENASIPVPREATEAVAFGIIDEGVEMVNANSNIIHKTEGKQLTSPHVSSLEKEKQLDKATLPIVGDTTMKTRTSDVLVAQSIAGNTSQTSADGKIEQQTKPPPAVKQQHSFIPTLQSSVSFDLHVPPALKSVLSDLVSVPKSQSDENGGTDQDTSPTLKSSVSFDLHVPPSLKSVLSDLVSVGKSQSDDNDGTDQGTLSPAPTDSNAPSFKAVRSELVDVAKKQTGKGTGHATPASQPFTHNTKSNGQAHNRSIKDGTIDVDIKNADSRDILDYVPVPHIAETAQSLYKDSKIKSKRLVENHLRWVEEQMTTTTTTTSSNSDNPKISVSSLNQNAPNSKHDKKTANRSETCARKKKKRFAKSLKNVLLFHRQQRGKVEQKEKKCGTVAPTRPPIVAPVERSTKAPRVSTIWHRQRFDEATPSAVKDKKPDGMTEANAVTVGRTPHERTATDRSDSKKSLEDNKPPKIVRNYKKVFPWLSNNSKKGPKSTRAEIKKADIDDRHMDVIDRNDGSTNESLSIDDDDNDSSRDEDNDDDDDEQPGIVVSPSWLENAATVAMEHVIALDPSLDFDDEYEDCPSFEYDDDEDILSVFLNPLDPPQERPEADDSLSLTDYIWSKFKCSHPCIVPESR